MKLEQTFSVKAPEAMVWEALIDVARVAPCLPGASISGREDDGSYKGEFKVKLGPTTAAYNGVLKMTSVDAEAQVATMDARGTDKRGQGGATASIVSSVHASGTAGETRVDIVTDFAITGRLARFGRGGMVQDVANRLLREFAANLEAQLQADGAAGAAAAEPGTVAPTAAAADDAPEGAAAVLPPTGTVAPPKPPAPAKPVSGLALLFGALLDRLRRLFKRKT
ncbi:MAG: carbon monoxide dehydrogenase [Solirubrobacterales bacterium]|nr:carbon monoxide dehydrogenase [Solirubrobacterales bacterium]